MPGSEIVMSAVPLVRAPNRGGARTECPCEPREHRARGDKRHEDIDKRAIRSGRRGEPGLRLGERAKRASLRRRCTGAPRFPRGPPSPDAPALRAFIEVRLPPPSTSS